MALEIVPIIYGEQLKQEHHEQQIGNENEEMAKKVNKIKRIIKNNT